MADNKHTALVVQRQRPRAEGGDVHSGVGPLRSMVATARSRLAAIEANYIGDRRAVEATQAKLFNQVKRHYQQRDRLRLIVRDRRNSLLALRAKMEHEAAHVADEHQRATTETVSNDERTTSAAENRKELGDEADRELRKLWKQLTLLYHPDRH